MPLIPAGMEAQLLKLMTSDRPSNPGDAAKRIAKIYGNYAKTAIAGPTKPVFTGAEPNVMAAAMLPAFSNPQGTPASSAQAFGQGFLAFWMSPLVAFAGGGTGVITVVPSPMLVSLLVSSFPGPGMAAQAAAKQLATCLDTATRAILVAVTVPPAPPVPTPLT